MTEIVDVLQKKYHFSEKLASRISGLFRTVNYPKNAYLIQQMDARASVYYIKEGFIREFYTFDSLTDEENTTQFVGEGEFYFSVQSFLEEKPSPSFVIAMEAVKALVIDRATIESYTCEIPELNLLLFDIAKDCLIKREKRNHIFLQARKSKERYQLFTQYHPELMHKVSDKNIASYLQINTSTLCRLKKAI